MVHFLLRKPVLLILSLCCLASPRVYGQLTVYNELSCAFTLTLECPAHNSRFQQVFAGDSLLGQWQNPAVISLPDSHLCQCPQVRIGIFVPQTGRRLVFDYRDYVQYRKSGGRVDDFSDPRNAYCFCCTALADPRFPCASPNTCGVIDIDTRACTLRIRKPEIPFCP